MVKSVVDPALEATSAAREASRRAEESNTAADIDHAIAEWKLIVEHAGLDQIKAEAQVEDLNFYASALLKRWNMSKRQDDIDCAIVVLEQALSKLPHKPNSMHYDLNLSIGNAYYQRYHTTKVDDDIVQAIQSLEDAHGASIVLKRSKQAATDLLPKLAEVYAQSCMDEIYGPEALQHAIDYYQGALIYIPPDLRGRIQLELGNCYKELCYHDWKVSMAQCSLEHYEAALKSLVGTDRWIEAVIGKAYISVVLIIDNPDESAKKKFVEWIGSVVNTSKDLVVLATFCHLRWLYTEDPIPLDWGRFLRLNSTIMWFSRSPLWNTPSIVHLLMFLATILKGDEGPSGGSDLSNTINTLEHLEMFLEKANWGDLTLFARFVLKSDHQNAVANSWIGYYTHIVGKAGDLLSKEPGFGNASKFPVKEEAERIRSLIQKKSKPTPRRTLAG
ncbi:hypothetical protein CPB86DRAFT_790984 [Serendipita vermifera]|nr:hypothetical protein CPB86DRAFT_790984 [Serendipita vermifera]